MLSTQRPQISGCSGFTPTSSRQCQQRAHLAWLDLTIFSFRPLTSVTTASAGACTNGATLAVDVISTKRSSLLSLAKSAVSASSANSVTSACRLPPTALAARWISISLLTATLTAMIRSQ
ncbi:hypothetical protein D3C81_1125500 [compost metagenome]